MKLVSKYIEKDRSGRVKLIPEDSEDMWHAYNLISEGDKLRATTIRRFVSETATGSTDKSSVRINLSIQAVQVDFDTQAAVVRVNGRNIEENKYVKLGQHHTLDLELHRPFTLFKSEWDVIALERIQESCDVSKKADVAAVVLEEGMANVCLVTQSMTVVRQRIEATIPRKRRGTTTDHDKAIHRFMDQIVAAILRHVDFNVVKVLLIASPGFTKDNLYRHMMQSTDRVLLDSKGKIVLAHCSSGHKHALAEVMQQPAMQERLSDTKYCTEVKALEQFYRLLGSEPSKAFYGYRHVRKAADRCAIAVLLVTDGLFRSASIAERRRYIELVELVRANGGQVLVFSALHTSGEQLALLTGVAAILSFPLPDLEDEVELEMEQERLLAQGALAAREGDELIEFDPTIALGE